jgi:ABC-2 type transport system permease protein
MAIFFLIEKEFKQLFRNKFLPRLIILMPIAMMLLFPWAASQEVTGLTLSVIDNDHSQLSQRLIQKITACNYFTLTDVSNSYDEALHKIESGKSNFIVEVQPDFERDLIVNGTSKVMVSANAVNGVKGSIGSGYLSSIIADFANDLREEDGAGGSINAGFSVIPRYEFNPSIDYKLFMVPALMAMLLTLLTGFLPALNIVSEKERGTIEQMNVTPVGKFTFILSKLVPYWCVGFFILAFAMFLAWLIYGQLPVGNVLTIYLFATLFILIISGFGLIVSNYSDNTQQAALLAFFFLVIFILTSGLFTPIASMPMWAQKMTLLNPLRYFIEVLRMVYLKGSAFVNMMFQFRAMCIYAVVIDMWAVLSYRKSS